MTVDSPPFVDSIIAGNGWPLNDDGTHQSDEDKSAPDNSPVVKIVEYTNAWGMVAWGLVFADDVVGQYRYDKPTSYVQNPKVIWVKKEVV